MAYAAERPARGLALSAWLILMALANAWTAYSYYDLVSTAIRRGNSLYTTGTLQWALPLLGLLAVVNIVAVVLLWLWRKIGLYIFIVTSIIALIINLVLGIPALTAVFGLVGFVILWLLLRSRWDYFE